MEATDWTHIKTLLAEALALPVPERAGYLDDACGDKAVRSEVEALIEAHQQAEHSGALASPFSARALPANDSACMDERIGPYRVVRELGRGGMGSVYLAKRDDGQFQQTVALKLIRRGLDTDDILSRFAFERQILAGLDHPNIARLYDGGVTDDGRPYFAMEYVEGASIIDHAREQALGVEARLRLFMQSCEAVAYAHQSLVVHRDLKPSNMLVTKEGTVKLLDFGIAKLLGAQESVGDGMPLTRTGVRPMTPHYAAPEQFTGQPITTATDVYALGVLLYELLTGRRPYELEGLSASETERLVCEVMPSRPSTVGHAEGIPRPRSQWQQVRNDLDHVVLKALAKEPERRYASAEAVAADVGRFLGGLPVTARAATPGYRVRMFVRRHRLGVAATTFTLLLLIAIVSFYTLRLRVERDRAQQAAAEAEAAAVRAEAISGFLEKILRAPNERWYNQTEMKGPDTPVRAVLDEAARQVDAEFADRPDLRADLHHILGDTYLALGLSGVADAHHREVLRLRQDLYAPPHPKLAEALYYLYTTRKKFPPESPAYFERIDLGRQAIQMQRVRNEGSNFPFMIHDMVNVLLKYRQYAEADSLTKEGLDFVENVFVQGHEGYRYRDLMYLALLCLQAELELLRGTVPDAERTLLRIDSLTTHMVDISTSRKRILQCLKGRLHVQQARYDEAEQALLACWGDAPTDDPGSDSPVSRAAEMHPGILGQASLGLVHLYEAWGRPAEAERYREMARRYHREIEARRTAYEKWRAETDS